LPTARPLCSPCRGGILAEEAAPNSRRDHAFRKSPASAGKQLIHDLVMKIHPFRFAGRGFTLIELLVVISIIAILAGLLLPVLGKARKSAQVTRAKTEINTLMGAITSYENDYSRFPASQKLRSNVRDGDFTFGTEYLFKDLTHKSLTNKAGVPYAPARAVLSGYDYENCNVEVMAALLDRTNLFWNANHAINPNKSVYLNVKEVSDARLPGVGPDGVYRDPWGSPYIISVDLNGDGKCRDAFYMRDSVSAIPGAVDKGRNGLFRSGGPDSFEANKPVMVWSFGPDQWINPALPADQGVNKDNVLSW
jgi:prepilin-type N-terminal cleavage/methylation domain-containing protein